MTKRKNALVKTRKIALLLILFFPAVVGCGAQVGDPSTGNRNKQAFGDAQSITYRSSDGRYDVVCNNGAPAYGRHEVDTATQVQSGEICLASSDPPSTGANDPLDPGSCPPYALWTQAEVDDRLSDGSWRTFPTVDRRYVARVCSRNRCGAWVDQPLHPIALNPTQSDFNLYVEPAIPVQGGFGLENLDRVGGSGVALLSCGTRDILGNPNCSFYANTYDNGGGRHHPASLFLDAFPTTAPPNDQLDEAQLYADDALFAPPPEVLLTHSCARALFRSPPPSPSDNTWTERVFGVVVRWTP